MSPESASRRIPIAFKPAFPENPRMSRMRIAREDQLNDGETLVFSFQRKGDRIDAILARFKGRFVAYENLCRHLPIPLDYGDSQFFDRDGEFLLCRTHGALYEPLSGRCVIGPCGGESLFPIAIEIADGEVWLAEEDAEPLPD